MTARKKIVVAQNLDLYPDQIKRMKSLGDVVVYKDIAKSPEEWLERCKDADIVCSGKFGLRQKIYELSGRFFSVPFVDIGWLDKEKLKQSSITVAYSPGCNKDAVSEWMIGIMLNMLRELPEYTNIKEFPENTLPKRTLGLTGKNVCVLGAGNIGSRVGKICEAFDMDVCYFRRGDNLMKSVKNADLIFNCLSRNPTTENILDKEFFASLKKGSYFISATTEKIYDIKALFEALENGTLKGAGIDAGDIKICDTTDNYYKKILAHPKILATPHIAFHTDVTARVANNMMIDNIEAWLKGKPINIVK